MRVLHLHGSRREMGRQYGEACRDEIHAFYEVRLGNAIDAAAQYGGRVVGEPQLLEVARRSIDATRRYDPPAWDELEGIAEGADLPVVKILAMNGLTDYRDVLSYHGDVESLGGCSAFIATGDVTADGKLVCGQTWDLATDNKPYVLGVHRRPDGEPETWSMTTVGCLSLIGLNDAGVAVGTTNIRTRDVRYGVNYLSVLHKALASASLDEAVVAVAGAERAGAHYFWLCDAQGRGVAMECSAREAVRVDVTSGSYVHCNHCKHEPIASMEAVTPNASTLARTRRLDELLDEHAGTIDVEAAEGFLADSAGGEDAILRDDFNGISTNGAVVIVPEDGRIVACHGLPDRSEWVDLKRA